MNCIRRSLIFVFFSFATLGLFAQDDKALSLKEIDALILNYQYNSALKQLAEYMEQNPEDFDRAQKRVSKILSARATYNKSATNLVDLIKGESTDSVEKMNRIQGLEKFEENPTENAVEFTNLARRTISLGEVLISYNRIMREGLALVRGEKFPDAAKKFEEGFEIKNDKSDIVFEGGGPVDENDTGILVVYENDITEPVRNSVSKIKSLVSGGFGSSYPSFKNLQSDCEKAYQEFVAAVKLGKIEGCNKAFDNVKKNFGKLAEYRNKIIDEARILDKADKLANQRNPLLLGTSYITFYKRFILGDDTNRDTGIIGAIDAFWNTRVEDMKARLNNVVYSTMDNIQKQVPENSLYAAVEKIDAQKDTIVLASDFAALSRDMHGLYDLPLNLDGSTVGSYHTNYQNSLGFVSQYLKNLDLSYDCVKRISEEGKLVAKFDPFTTVSEQVLVEYLNQAHRYEQIKKDSENYLEFVSVEYQRENDYYIEQERKKAELEQMMELTGITLDEVNKSQKKSAGVEIMDSPLDLRDEILYFNSVCNQNIENSAENAKNVWGIIAQNYYSNGKENYDSLEKMVQENNRLISGTLDEETGLNKKYPVLARTNARKLISSIQNGKIILQSHRSNLDDGDAYASANEAFVSGKVQIDELIKMFDQLVLENRQTIAAADPLIRAFEKAYEEGKAQYERAVAAFKKNDFDGANAAVDKASEKLAEALDYEFEEEVRVLREETLADLANRILVAENEQVIRDVFALKEEATTAYYSSQFDAAETALTKAQARWAKTNPEPDSEIEELLTVVRNVRGLAYGRVLSASDPHYPELSYSLDLAKLSLERGAKAKQAGNKSEAEAAFNTALSNVRNVQNVYPLNKEARLVSLKLQREMDPVGFPKQFENQLTAARKNNSLNERLADLQDLYEINPKYPGLKDEIYSLEEDLGMHPKRVVVQKDVKKQVGSKLSDARKLFKAAGNDEARLNQALAAVNQVIALDSTNRDAKNLKLEIQLKIGAQATAILSQQDEKMYAEAGRLFNQRKFAEANAVMETLWQKPAAKRNRKVVDLRNRILRRL
ncbi:MAG: hypothetical protein KBT11_00570 [Treponema sp.]|nr:hypothetical protein [Candidatus Treponema equifaecale]